MSRMPPLSGTGGTHQRRMVATPGRPVLPGQLGRIVRTTGFKSLNRQSLFELCEVVDTEGRIVAGPEWGDRWRLWVREPGVRASQATLSR